MDPKHYPGAACPNGHTRRYVSTGKCVDCNRSHVRASRQRTRDHETPDAVEARRKKARDRYLRERDKHLAYQRQRQRNLTREQRKKRAAAKREWYYRNSDAAIEQHKRWKASNPDKVRRQACVDFARYRARHPRRRKEIKDAWVDRNRERVNAYNRAWIKAHPDVARRAKERRGLLIKNAPGEHPLPKEMRALRLAAVGKLCGYCLSPMPTLKDVALDHVQPLYIGGEHSLRNLNPLCRRCHARKGPRVYVLKPPRDPRSVRTKTVDRK